MIPHQTLMDTYTICASMFKDMSAHYDPAVMQARRAQIDGGPLLRDERQRFEEGCQFIERRLPDEPALVAARQLPLRRMKESLWLTDEDIVGAMYYWDAPQLMLNPVLFGRLAFFIVSVIHEGRHRRQHLSGTTVITPSWIGNLDVRSALESDAYRYQVNRTDVLTEQLRRECGTSKRELANALDRLRADSLAFAERWATLNTLVRKHRPDVEKAGELITRVQRAGGSTDALIEATLQAVDDEPATSPGKIIIASAEALRQRTQVRLDLLSRSVSDFVVTAQPLLRELALIPQ